MIDPSLDLSQLDALDEGELVILHPKTLAPVGWTWTFYGPGHRITIDLSNRVAQAALKRASARRQAQVMVNSLTDITTGAKSAGQGFADFETAAVRAVEQVMIKMMIVEPLMRSLQDLFLGGINLSAFGFNPIAGVTGSAKGNIFAAGHIVPFADGGIPDVVSSPTIAPMALFGE